ncbi:MAG: hypothetical protein HY710_10385 [Candidatus Latescibacteria bacterium]|nr:hypothetical protein [Candidatus Latescibacterota bacterium]
MSDVDREIARLLDQELTEAEREEMLGRLRADPEAFARWERLQKIVDAARQIPRPSAPEGFADAVIARIRAAKVVPFRQRIVSQRWWTAVAAAACVAFVLGAGLGFSLAVRRPQSAPLQADRDKIVYVRFVFVDPNTEDVRVVGDFNGWDVNGLPLRETGGRGVWTAAVPLRPGMYQYMFIVDGMRWVTDPTAEAYLDDGFGNRNALLHVPIPNERKPSTG